MTDAGQIITGLRILRHYDGQGSVSLSFTRALYAGPAIEAPEDDPITSVDRAVLLDNGWEFDPDIMRWGWSK